MTANLAGGRSRRVARSCRWNSRCGSAAYSSAMSEGSRSIARTVNPSSARKADSRPRPAPRSRARAGARTARSRECRRSQLRCGAPAEAVGVRPPGSPKASKPGRGSVPSPHSAAGKNEASVPSRYFFGAAAAGLGAALAVTFCLVVFWVFLGLLSPIAGTSCERLQLWRG